MAEQPASTGDIVILTGDVHSSWVENLTEIPSLADPDPRIHPDHRPRFHTSWQTRTGSREAASAQGPVGPRTDQPRQIDSTTPTPEPAPTPTGSRTDAPAPA